MGRWLVTLIDFCHIQDRNILSFTIRSRALVMFEINCRTIVGNAMFKAIVVTFARIACFTLNIKIYSSDLEALWHKAKKVLSTV